MSENKIEAIKKAVSQLNQITERVKQRQEYWRNFTEDVLYRTLTQAKEWGLEATVKKTYRFINLETIYLSVKNEPSTFIEEYEEETHPITKHGAHLIYRQTPSGLVCVKMYYPYIQGVIQKSDEESITVELLEPQEITQEKILDHVLIFLNKLCEWESLQR
ncbi:MAG: hypothetical protein NZ551_05055 [Microscillaceae bacterium]|nr:hypothetical protein [Microscillaceae bacterium]MDW8460563.1 hypothetical protein [Cytophagales bacterium]